LEYLFVILSTETWYNDIKTAADMAGLHTTISLWRPGTTVRVLMGEIANLMLKFNIKVGGDNWEFDASKIKFLQGRQTMIVGIDVIPPGPYAMKGAPSVPTIVVTTTPRLIISILISCVFSTIPISGRKP
jgi:hypothetical protein